MPRVARLDRRCVFRSPTRTPDGGGGESIAWTDRFSRWGGLEYAEPSAQAEAVAGGAERSLSRAVLVVEADPETRVIGPDWVVQIDGATVWAIQEVQPTPRFEWVRMAVSIGGAL